MGQRGRPAKHYKTTWNETVLGLSKRKNGRFYPVGRSDISFGSDETAAIHRFKTWRSEQSGSPPAGDVTLEWSDDGIRSLFRSDAPIPYDAGAFAASDLIDHGKRIRELPGHENITSLKLSADYVRAYYRNLILTDPDAAARELNLKGLRYYRDDAKPTKRTELTKIGELYVNRKRGNITPKELAKSITWWAEFCKFCGVRSVQELDFDAFDQYASTIKREQQKTVQLRHGEKKRKGLRSKTFTRNRFHMIRTILNHGYRCRKISPEEIARLKGEWAEPVKAPKKPRRKKFQISPDHYRAMLAEVKTDFDRALLLTMANAAFYPVDCHRLTWGNVNLAEGHVVYIRQKKDAGDTEGVIQICILWLETVDALKQLRPDAASDDDPVFTLRRKRPVHPDTVYDHFLALKKSAGIKVHFEARSLRDTSFTIAIQNAAQAQAKALTGHKLDGSSDDEYLIRNPAFVADACEALQRYYLGD